MQTFASKIYTRAEKYTWKSLEFTIQDTNTIQNTIRLYRLWGWTENRPQVRAPPKVILDMAGKPSQVRAPAGKWGTALQLEGLASLGAHICREEIITDRVTTCVP